VRLLLASSLYETFAAEEAKRIWDKFEFMFTPKLGSWLNMAEIELHVLNDQCLSRHISTMEEKTDRLIHGKKTETIRIAISIGSSHFLTCQIP